MRRYCVSEHVRVGPCGGTIVEDVCMDGIEGKGDGTENVEIGKKEGGEGVSRTHAVRDSGSC